MSTAALQEPQGGDDAEAGESDVSEPEPIADGDAEIGDLGVEDASRSEASTDEDSVGSADTMDSEWKNGAGVHDWNEPIYPDNQLGLWGWPEDVPGGIPDDFPSPVPSPEPLPDVPSPPPVNSESPSSKRKAFWKKFVVPWPRPCEPPVNDDGLDSGDDSNDSKSNDSSEDSDHRDSETLSLSPNAGVRSLEKESGFQSDSESGVSSPMSMVEPEDFEKAMGEESERRHHKNATMHTLSDKSTLETPKCDRPSWWGFPMVSTPPKVSVTRLSIIYIYVCKSFPSEFSRVPQPTLVPMHIQKLSTQASEMRRKPKKKNKSSGSKVVSKKGKKKASFKVSRSKPGLKAKRDGRSEGPSEYAGYDITHLPEDVRPDMERRNLGKHSYTLRVSSGACLEVLLQKEAYFVKAVGPAGTGPTGQVSWSKHEGPHKAFIVAKQRAGFERWERDT